MMENSSVQQYWTIIYTGNKVVVAKRGTREGFA